MKNRPYSQDSTLVSHRGRGGTGKRSPLVGCLIGLILLFVLAVAAFGGYYLLSPRGQVGPLVLIHGPQNGEHLLVGQSTTVQAIATDERKIVRVELWVDGQLLESQTSNVSGGIASFPLLADWQPASAGAHTLMVRAFNSRGARAHTSINVNAIADRDADGVADDTDACPDQPGLDDSNGCPDRDLDGTPDSADACPDVAGSPAAAGCAAVVEGDRDGDGSPDTADTCPDVPGSPLLEGCPDSDGDLVPDLRDACPAEPGSGSGGCPVPAGDADGDGILDGVDVCPAEWGVPEHAGCPEVPPGPGGGDPGTGITDSDGDGASDDVDPCPTETGLPENDYCPPPGEDPGPGESGPELEFPDFFLQAYIPAWVEFEALHFEVSHSYDEIWCYAQLADGDVERYDFDPGPGNEWDIAESLGGVNSVHLALTPGDPVDVFAECYGRTTVLFFPITHPLGIITSRHAPEEWDGHVIEMESIAGEPGHSFQVRYHLCSPSCDATALQPPAITDYSAGRDDVHLNWNWEGDRRSIAGFKLYLNGNFIEAFPPEASHTVWRHIGSYCVDRWEFYLTTYGGPDPHHADIESPPGNTVAVDGIQCQKSIRVKFAALTLHDSPADEPGRDGQGPLAGTFAVSASGNTEALGFHAAHCIPIPFPPHRACWGYRLTGGEHSIQGMFDWIRAEHDDCRTSLCHGSHYGASTTDTVTIQVNPGDELTFAGLLTDLDEGNPNDTLFDEGMTLDTSVLSPDSTYTLTIPGEHVDLTVLIDLFPFDP